MLLKLVAFGALAASYVTAAGVSRAIAIPPQSRISWETYAEARTTNAERLARGLPLKAPHRRKHNLGRTETSSVPLLTKTGVLQMKNSNGDIMGYVSKTANSFGEYGSLQTQGNALHISFSYDPTKPLQQLDFIGTDSSIYSTFPLVGFVNGFASTSSNLGSGSNYLYVAGVSQTPKGSPPVTQANAFSTYSGSPETVESAVWSIDSATGKVTAQWINTDGTVPTTYLCYTAGADAILLTGNVALLAANFGQVTQIDLYFVEDT
ncbi:hypothetical protein BDZ89DRAFT_1132441 [Hymenopellis radicata]|nr:hypothetical protein BDZ89DRAFT_1132441 [Hymenopellis radicata]